MNEDPKLDRGAALELIESLSAGLIQLKDMVSGLPGSDLEAFRCARFADGIADDAKLLCRRLGFYREVTLHGTAQDRARARLRQPGDFAGPLQHRHPLKRGCEGCGFVTINPGSIYWEGITCSLFSFFSGLPKAPPARAACRSVTHD
jgi:hypothetical protein